MGSPVAVPMDPFLSDDVDVRARLAQLGFAFAIALSAGDLQNAHAIRGEALLLHILRQDGAGCEASSPAPGAGPIPGAA